MSKIAEFFRGTGTDNTGRSLDDIIKMSNAALEIAHDWVQWAFPLQTLSNFNVDAPIPTADDLVLVKADPLIIDNYGRLCHRFLAFLGLKEVEGKIEPAEDFEERKKLVWVVFNHNYLRITRFLESMRLFGQKDRSAALYACLVGLAAEKRIFLSDNGRGYWAKTQE